VKIPHTEEPFEPIGPTIIPNETITEEDCHKVVAKVDYALRQTELNATSVAYTYAITPSTIPQPETTERTMPATTEQIEWTTNPTEKPFEPTLPTIVANETITEEDWHKVVAQVDDALRHAQLTATNATSAARFLPVAENVYNALNTIIENRPDFNTSGEGSQLDKRLNAVSTLVNASQTIAMLINTKLAQDSGGDVNNYTLELSSLTVISNKYATNFSEEPDKWAHVEFSNTDKIILPLRALMSSTKETTAQYSYAVETGEKPQPFAVTAVKHHNLNDYLSEGNLQVNSDIIQLIVGKSEAVPFSEKYKVIFE